MRPLAFLLFLPACGTGFAPNTSDSPATDDNPDAAATGETGAPTTGPGTIPDQAPVADAGADGTSGVAAIAALDGSASYDPDGDPLTWTWAFLSIPTESSTTLLNETTATPSFWVDRPGAYELRLTVSDGALASTDDVTITASTPNTGPVAIAGPDQIVTRGDVVQLNGSASYDPENDPLTFTWTMTSRPAGSAAAITGNGPLPQFMADTVGTYVVSLRVSDDNGNDSPVDELQVDAQAPSSGGGGGGCSCTPPPGKLPPSLGFADVAGGFAPFAAIPAGLRFRRRKQRKGV